jgi:hypothetical protein
MSGKDDKVKSAFEIAMERVQKLGSLSDEEKRKLKEEELGAGGKALAERYLSGLSLRDLDIELGRHAEADRSAVRCYAVSRLLEAIDLGNTQDDDRILSAIEHLSGDSGLVRVVKDILSEYHEAMERAKRENWGRLEAAKRNELALRGISGSAVEPVVETSPEWLQIRGRRYSSYQERLEDLKAGRGRV